MTNNCQSDPEALCLKSHQPGRLRLNESSGKPCEHLDWRLGVFTQCWVNYANNRACELKSSELTSTDAVCTVPSALSVSLACRLGDKRVHDDSQASGTGSQSHSLHLLTACAEATMLA